MLPPFLERVGNLHRGSTPPAAPAFCAMQMGKRGQSCDGQEQLVQQLWTGFFQKQMPRMREGQRLPTRLHHVAFEAPITVELGPSCKLIIPALVQLDLASAYPVCPTCASRRGVHGSPCNGEGGWIFQPAGSGLHIGAQGNIATGSRSLTAADSKVVGQFPGKIMDSEMEKAHKQSPCYRITSDARPRSQPGLAAARRTLLPA